MLQLYLLNIFSRKDNRGEISAPFTPKDCENIKIENIAQVVSSMMPYLLLNISRNIHSKVVIVTSILTLSKSPYPDCFVWALLSES